MNQTQKFLITGGTGNQGGAVIKRLLQDEIPVRALCRDPGGPKARGLMEQGVEVVKGDLNDPDSYTEHLTGIGGIFSVQAFTKNTVQEIRQGTSLAKLAKDHGVPHFVYTSVAAADQNSGIPHFESKFEIEEHLKSIDLPYTILRPASFNENMLMPRVKNSILKGKFVMPLEKETVQQYVSVEDIGIVAGIVLQQPSSFLNQTLTLATDQLSMLELTELFELVLNKKIKYQKLPGLITRLAMGKDLTKMFKWMDQNEFTYADIARLKAKFPTLGNMENWIRANFL